MAELIKEVFTNPGFFVVLIYLPQLILMFTSKRFSRNFNNTISNSGRDYIVEILAGVVLAGILIYAYFSNLSTGLIYLVFGFFVYAIGLVLTYTGYFQFLFSKEKLVQHGIYALSRNPTYLFASIGMMGIFILISSYVLFFLVVLHFILTHLIVLKEETYLLKKFGKIYENYGKKVRRYF